MTNKSDLDNEKRQQMAIVSKLKQVSIIWLVPVIAILIAFYVIYHSWSTEGPEIQITMPTAEGIEAGKTAIKIRDVSIGTVTKVNLSADHKNVIVTAQLDASAKKLLFKDSQFWVVKPRFERGGVSGLSTLLSGSYIQLQPGSKGAYCTSFNILPDPPITAPDVPGLRLVLTAKNVKILNIGDPVLFEGYPVGRIEKAYFDTRTRQMHYRLFVQRPYDQLVTSNSKFWIVSGISFDLNANGLKVSTNSLEALLSGGIAFDVPPNRDSGHLVKNFTNFNLYTDENQAQEHSYERVLPYIIVFKDSVRGLEPGAPVEYKGVRIGTVGRVPYSVSDQVNANLYENGIPVLVNIELARIDRGTEKRTDDQWRSEFNSLILRGFSAKLKNGNLVTGALFVDLDFSKHHLKKLPSKIGGIQTIPSVSGGLGLIENKVVNLLDKLNALPLEKTLADADGAIVEGKNTIVEMRKSLTLLNQLLNSQAAKDLPKETLATLQQLQMTLQGFTPNSQNYQAIHETLKSLNATLQTIQPVIRTINQNPNALIFAPSHQDIQPKGAQ